MASGQKLPKKREDLVEDGKSSTGMPTDLEKQEDHVKQEDQAKTEEAEYMTGIKLWIMMSGVILVIFLMLLDISIVSTVRRPLVNSDLSGSID